MPRLAVLATGPDGLGEAGLSEAARLAHALGLPLITRPNPAFDFLLTVTERRLELSKAGHPGSVFVEFVTGSMGYRRLHGGYRQALARAVGVKPHHPVKVVDVTAGLGRDGFVLAALGCRVWLAERCGPVYALLLDGLKRAHQALETREIAARMTLVHDDARRFLAAGTVCPQVVYLDPMFPEQAKSARSHKAIEFLRSIIGADDDAPQLLAAGLKAAGQRVVVKRPRTAPPLTGPNPSFALVGKTVRYDVYQCA